MGRRDYRGRFAPSPTGPLHFGSLVAAVASYADARHHQGAWLVRIEDVDETRSRPAAETDILRALQAFGMQWDEPLVRQSERKALYDRALDALVLGGHAFRCNCSRKAITELAQPGCDGPIYPGTCRRVPPPMDVASAWRVVTVPQELTFDDRVCERITQNLADSIGDFVVRRIDGFTAYQLAVVVDDHEQSITHVVRGADLLWSTPRQCWLQQLLGYNTPAYAHVPLVCGDDGRKLSKRDDAHPVNEARPVEGLLAAWSHLGQPPPSTTLQSVADFWRWASSRWEIAAVPCDQAQHHESTDTL